MISLSTKQKIQVWVASWWPLVFRPCVCLLPCFQKLWVWKPCRPRWGWIFMWISCRILLLRAQVEGYTLVDDEYWVGRTNLQVQQLFVEKIHWLSENTFPETKIAPPFKKQISQRTTNLFSFWFCPDSLAPSCLVKNGTFFVSFSGVWIFSQNKWKRLNQSTLGLRFLRIRYRWK